MPVQSHNLLLAFASTVILGFGTYDHIFVLSKTSVRFEPMNVSVG
jgi:hypothetical protein